MRFGIYIPNVGAFADPAEFVELAVRAEASGWDGVFIWDMLTGVLADGDDGRVIDPWVTLSAAAVQTNSIRLGPMVTPLARRRPRKVGLEGATLSRLSRSRLILGVGLGDKPEAEFARFGDDPDPRARASALDASLETIARMWTEAGVEIPIWTAGKWPAKSPARRAARWDGMFPLRSGGVSLSVNDCAALRDYIAQHRQSAEPFDLALGARSEAVVASEGLVAAYAAAGVTWWLEMFWPQDTFAAAIERASEPPI